jgi:hypothetical protein
LRAPPSGARECYPLGRPAPVRDRRPSAAPRILADDVDPTRLRPVTSLVSEVTIDAVRGNAYDTISSSVGLVAILLLLFVLTAKEIARARDASDAVVGAYDTAILPLAISAGIIISLRILSLL